MKALGLPFSGYDECLQGILEQAISFEKRPGFNGEV
jgi:hypothetical protein